MRITKNILPILLIAGFINSCGFARQEEAEPQRYNESRYTNMQPIEFNISKIDVVSEFTPSFRAPNVEHRFPVSIERTAKLWANDRLEAVSPNSDKIATFTIKDASVTETTEKSDRAFYKDSLIYRATLHVVLEVSDTKSISRAQTEINAWRELKIPVDTSVEEKDRYWNDMVQKLFDEFNVKMEQQIHQYLNMHIKNSSFIKEF